MSDAVKKEYISQGNEYEPYIYEYALMWICSFFGKNFSPSAFRHGQTGDATPSATTAIRLLENAGFSARLVQKSLNDIPALLCPVILLCHDRKNIILLAREEEQCHVILPDMDGESVVISAERLAEIYTGYALLVKPKAEQDRRSGIDDAPGKGHWLFRIMWNYRRYYYNAAIGAVLINVLTLAGTFFTMNVYDRVIPNQAYVTLWALAAGVFIAILLEFACRITRAYLIDIAGKKADLIIGARLFKKALSVRMEYRPASAGSFANQIREYESVRDFFSSATLITLSDLPFAFLFIAIIAAIGGPLAWVPLCLFPIALSVCLLVQIPLSRIMKENLRGGSLRQGLLIESLTGLETLKATSSEGHMLTLWEKYSAELAAVAMKSRLLSGMTTHFITTIQQLQTVILVSLGVYLIGDGVISVGALMGSVILSQRVIAPLGQVVSLAVRAQQALVALGALNRLMITPTERDAIGSYIANPVLNGNIQLRGVGFSYPDTTGKGSPVVVDGANITIREGERIAIIGRIGSGKSTLLRIIAGLYLPTKGQLLFDDLDSRQIDIADLRANVSFIAQDNQLFFGSLRDNLLMGRQHIDAARLTHILQLTGLDAIARNHPAGLDMPVGENGCCLSGGQRQLVALARSLLVHPRVLLMDEPTSAMDNQTETVFLRHFRQISQGQTLIVVTHRLPVLELVDRLIVMDGGKVAADGPKEAVLEQLRGAEATRLTKVKAHA
ncbi:type I secretion system permease/ATPase [Enterobacillus tribolii]|uniref:Colicin V processing peptidase n=1 Tax=Enterobacillus tribolii TaxID=1487935 RepID=A0A370QET7_9GAMM|nr:type I secretion system permease/ATPase [Enterobacillus tribolii]MBW7984150.1 type I secretion system permease/ATPase [Enterobacillus tribolii]RDK86789.1 colicin V processing peptidase [Enterobacillus tribolii]